MRTIFGKPRVSNRATVLPLVFATLLFLAAFFFYDLQPNSRELLPWLGLAGGTLGALFTPRNRSFSLGSPSDAGPPS